MAKEKINNLRLGIFVLCGLLFLILLLYMIGKNRNLFGSTYELKARFENLQGLVVGNNVRFAGIQTGTVKKIKIINDSTIEITMLIEDKMKTIIKNNAEVAIGTDGLVGNKVVNITPVKIDAPFAKEDDILASKVGIDTDDMLQTLNKTNKDIAIVASDLKKAIQNINNSNALWDLLNDKTIPTEIKNSVVNIKSATNKASLFTNSLNDITNDIKNGNGSLGSILKDKALINNLNDAIAKIKSVGDDANELGNQIKAATVKIENEISNGNGAANALLYDTMMVYKINQSLNNIQNGTDGFNQNMEALKHNFLLRGYFKKLEKKKLERKEVKN